MKHAAMDRIVYIRCFSTKSNNWNAVLQKELKQKLWKKSKKIKKESALSNHADKARRAKRLCIQAIKTSQRHRIDTEVRWMKSEADITMFFDNNYFLESTKIIVEQMIRSCDDYAVITKELPKYLLAITFYCHF